MSRAPDARAGVSSRNLRYLLRIAAIGLAGTALAWVATSFPDISDPSISKMADRVARGENYDPGGLRRVIADNVEASQQRCNSKVLRRLLILQLSATDISIRGTDLRTADSDTASLDAVARALLRCAPTESSGWLGVYWSEIRRNGFGPRALGYLSQSYELAPHEGWIQLIRAPFALRSFDALPPALKEASVRDFEDIFRAQLFPSAAVIFKQAAASVRSKLLDRTCDDTQNERAVFRHFVEESGLTIRHACYPAGPLPGG